MTTYLLDANVIIPLVVAEHTHRAAALAWFAEVADFALCPVVEGALVRYLVREGLPVGMALRVLQRFHAQPGCQFWPDSLSYAQANLTRVLGHRQVTDAYLVALAATHRDALLATFDEGLVATFPGETVLVPRRPDA